MFIYSPVIESGVNIIIPVKKLVGVLSCKSNSQRAYSQMLARRRSVIEGLIDIMNDDRKVNKNNSFWKHAEALELNKGIVLGGSGWTLAGALAPQEGNAKALPFAWTVSNGMLRFSDKFDTRRKNISALNHVERLRRHPSLFLNYHKLLATNKGMNFAIDESKPEGGSESKEPRTNYKLQSTKQTEDLTMEPHEEPTARKKMGKTTTEDNFKVDRFFWQSCLSRRNPMRIY